MLVVVQMGHVGRTTGATGAPGEQAFTAAAGEAARAEILAVGHQCRLIPADPPKTQYAGDMFVAIHADGGPPESNGASVGYMNSEGRRAAGYWKQHYINNGWQHDWHPDNYTTNLAGYYGNRQAAAAGNPRAFILEAGFITNPIEGPEITSPEGLKRLGVSIAATVVDILGATCPPPISNPPGIPPYPGTFRIGDQGRGVAVWQHQFNQKLGTGLAEDGIFGAATHHVVWFWQDRHPPLITDGVAGPATWHSLLFEPA